MVVRLGVIGLGGVSSNFMVPAAMESTRVRMTALADADPDALARGAERTGVERTFADYREMLARGDFDLVYVATPNPLHAEHAIAAARAGKHVLCEKPLAGSLEAGEAMVAAAREHRVLLAVDYMTRFHRVHLEAKRLLAEGAIGRLCLVRSHWSYYKAGRSGESRPTSETRGGGPLADVGCYSLDMFRHVCGLEVESANGVLGRSRSASSEPGVWESHDAAALVLRLEGGVPAYLDASFDFFESGFELVGETGALFGRECFGQRQEGILELVDSRRRGATPRIVLDLSREVHAPHDMYLKTLEHVVDGIERGASLANSGEIGLRDLRTFQAVYRQNGLGA